MGNKHRQESGQSVQVAGKKVSHKPGHGAQVQDVIEDEDRTTIGK